MSIQTSVLGELLQRSTQLRPQLYFKSSLTALSHAMEDQVLASDAQPLIIASFQKERFYRQEAHRYERIAAITPHVYVLAAPETSFTNASRDYETIAFDPTDQLSREWHLVVIGPKYSTCLICQERQNLPAAGAETPHLLAMDQTRRFEGIWTFDPEVSRQAAEILLDRIGIYRPEIAAKLAEAKAQFVGQMPATRDVDPDPFAQRLVTYLQAGQYKLQKAYRSIAAKEQQERLVNLITSAMRQSLDPNEIFKVAVNELGAAMQADRCLIYRGKATDREVTISHEFLSRANLPSLLGQIWPLANHRLFQAVAQQQESISIVNTQAANSNDSIDLAPLAEQIQRWQIGAWLIVPIVYQGRLLGVIELHQAEPQSWSTDGLGLVEAVAAQLGVALIQAESYANLEDLNQQLEALERTRSNLIAITGHELRTPLSTIQVCLESLASEPDMLPELRQVMLSTALTDAERMRKLVQDFITLSRLESGRVEWHLEPVAIDECVTLALSSLRTRQSETQLPQVTAEMMRELPPVRADGERLVEVLSKLLDNACKFTQPDGTVLITAQPNGGKMLEVTIADTGRGIEPNRLETVFDRFYQEEGALRRTTGGTGLGLAICRQIVKGLGGQIWAESAGRDQGSRFHFTLPLAQESLELNIPALNGSAEKAAKRRASRKRAALG
ncbi:MAG: GAF domain-containing protein [Pegethrix bostrychoides GSE-TBD4-15B]|jgi:DICT domain-containing protein/signal transduction histidine kinase|uniref:histidine kinase n=1 Tax=Pegethrix bostrychoides GSE-TBD4-15B TaxID=2839662 RepID=A0A951U3E6_9CYAN|nr:GAF domain-containing protein [Pegethrix bostrychoides GSE-TBD4-15B]